MVPRHAGIGSPHYTGVPRPLVSLEGSEVISKSNRVSAARQTWNRASRHGSAGGISLCSLEQAQAPQSWKWLYCLAVQPIVSRLETTQDLGLQVYGIAGLL